MILGIYNIIHNFHTDMDGAFDKLRSNTITYSGTLINNPFGLNAANGKFTAPKNTVVQNTKQGYLSKYYNFT